MRNRNYSAILVFILLVWLALDVFSALTASREDLVCRFEDDAYFYATISRNVVENGTLSFDGVSRTNGFHPLWMGILIVTRSIFSDQISFLRAVSVFSALLMFAAGFVVVKKLNRQYSTAVVLVVLILLLR